MERDVADGTFWCARALDFIDSVEAVGTLEQVAALFEKEIAQAGFSAFIMCGLPDATTSFQNRIIANGWSAEWSAIYLKEDLARYDPVERYCLQSAEPFDWSQAPYDPETEPRAHDVMRRARDFKMAQGFCVPIHYGDGPGAAISIAGERPELGRGIRPAMHLMALYAHHRMRSLLRPHPIKKVLTDREREVLAWIAMGKSSWETSVILGLSERTVNWFIAEAAQKLDASNRTQAVVNAIRTRELKI